MDSEARQILIGRLREDLMGPSSPDELIADRPADRYLTGILFPQRTEMPAEEDEQLGLGNDEEEDGSTSGRDTVSLFSTIRPATMGISFAVEALEGNVPRIDIRILCGTYVQEWDETAEGEDEPKPRTRANERWRRTPRDIRLPSLTLETGPREIDLQNHGLPGSVLFVQVAAYQEAMTVTTALVNVLKSSESRVENEEKSFFQTQLDVEAAEGSVLLARPSRRSILDEDGQTAALIYRNAVEYSVGHTCSAAWDLDVKGKIVRVRSTWLPEIPVPAVSTAGDPVFNPLRTHPELKPLSASWLAEADEEALFHGLSMLPRAYDQWLRSQESSIPELPDELRTQARKHVEICRECIQRMDQSIRLIRQDIDVLVAFRLANKAMVVQRRWAYGDDDLEWRPFQLAFQLLALASTADRSHPERGITDLLWFPTGGGKTEAYLGLTAFVLFLRRIKAKTAEEGAGVAVLMRYTLRLLTIQQFQRAATLILACEHLRRGNELPARITQGLGDIPFSIGLWVGGGATPNTVAEARNVEPGSEITHRQITTCPACHQPLGWNSTRHPDAMHTICDNNKCPLAATSRHLPIWTIDEDIYREKPSLVVATIDKFAQITRKPETGVLFGLDTLHLPPDLIIQDELHLISGPLGTIAALYEAAIDRLCTRNGLRPKVIGSTATIRRAREQIRALFDRDAYQFPPPCLNAENSCFSITDKSAPGRLYVGVTTAGRSPKFTLQAVCASLLQALSDSGIIAQRRDPYWTLVAYFNSLRELGGALVLMQDDVGMSMREFANRRGEPLRELGPPEELTSRKRSSDIPVILADLHRKAGDPGAYDVLLATNMISVGMDIPRLGLMVVNGQPKGVAEYIQATSRVGRTHPGLIVSVYNNGKARDRSFYETFASWHSTFYRDVEATNVTPFASRAQDKALHAVVVALVRHIVQGMKVRPALSPKQRIACNEIARILEERASHVDAEEVPGVTRKLQLLFDEWSGRVDLRSYWNDFGNIPTLMISAEQFAALSASGGTVRRAWPTLNSMREVEPGSPFVLAEVLRTPMRKSDAQAE